MKVLEKSRFSFVLKPSLYWILYVRKAWDAQQENEVLPLSLVEELNWSSQNYLPFNKKDS